MFGRLSPALLYVLMRSVGAFASALVLTYELAYHTVVVGLNPFQLVLVGVVLESMTFLFEQVIPELRERGMTDEQLDQMMVENPKGWLAGG